MAEPLESGVTHEVAVEGVVDELEKQLVEEQERP